MIIRFYTHPFGNVHTYLMANELAKFMRVRTATTAAWRNFRLEIYKNCRATFDASGADSHAINYPRFVFHLFKVCGIGNWQLFPHSFFTVRIYEYVQSWLASSTMWRRYRVCIQYKYVFCGEMLPIA